MSASLRSAILDAADAIEEAREALCMLDAASGDGDHGVTMTIGARRVRAQLEGVASDDPEVLVRAAAIGMAGAGGAIGAIYGRGLLAIAGRLREGPDAVGGAGQLDLLASAIERAAVATSGLGAGPGDKTVLDALLPAAAALEATARSGGSLRDGLAAADAAAQAGADATAGLEARIGRSARHAEQSKGTIDPGAASLAIIVHALVASALGPAEG
jgi:dihydroxyacetone kinase-like protein